MPYLYPRLPLPRAEKIAADLAHKSIEDLVGISQTKDQTALFSPTGGSRITESFLVKLRSEIRNLAAENGYPNPANENQGRLFDIACGKYLGVSMLLHPSEASHIEMWAFLTCVLVPDIVRWRFYDEGPTSIDRFIGSNRGLRRNTLGRLWWRTFLLKEEHKKDPYELISWLGEDELTQITERPKSLAAEKRLLHAFCWGFVDSVRRYREVPRRELIREAAKRIFRLRSIIIFEALDDKVLDKSIKELFQQTAELYLLEKTKVLEQR